MGAGGAGVFAGTRFEVVQKTSVGRDQWVAEEGCCMWVSDIGITLQAVQRGQLGCLSRVGRTWVETRSEVEKMGSAGEAIPDRQRIGPGDVVDKADVEANG